MKGLMTYAAIASTVLALAACDAQPPSADQQQRQQQEQASKASNMSVGFPSVVNFTEKRNYKMIIEKRDEANLSTYTYFVGMHNEHAPLCHSLGYGIPESEQYTNPARVAQSSTERGIVALPQADPNGLFSSPSSNGTWVLCAFKDGSVQPVRSEPNVVTLPEPWANLDQTGM